ncbi:MAG TPA: cupin domain-containing protein [Burkholderiaceae bacterium]
MSQSHSPAAFDLNARHVHFNPQGLAETIDASTLWSLPPDELNARFGHLLVSSFEFNEDWATWEMHPHGDELACLLAGEAELVLRQDGKENNVILKAGASFLIPRGAWHTARTSRPCRLLLVTHGKDTQVAPKDEAERV